MPTLDGLTQGLDKAVAGLESALGRCGGALMSLLPRKARRLIDKIERRRTRPFGHYAAAGFLGLTVVYGVVAGGHVLQIGDAALAAIGFDIDNVTIAGHRETSEIAVLEKLDIGGRSLLTYDAAEAKRRLAELPWVAEAVIRKFYPDTLAVEIVERVPYALWQNNGLIAVIDAGGHPIEDFSEGRFSTLPLMVGAGAEKHAAEFWPKVAAEPLIAARMRAAVRVADRRWDLHLENGVTVKLPEQEVERALADLARLDAEQGLFSRDVTVIDLRLPDRVTVRLPEGRPAAGEEPGKTAVKVAGARP